MNEHLFKAKERVNELDKKRIDIVASMSRLNVWLADKNLTDLTGRRVSVHDYQILRSQVVKDKYKKEAELIAVKADLKKARIELTSVEHEVYSEKMRREKSPDRIEKQLIHQCASVFENMERRGLGFDFNEKKIIEKIREYVLSS